MYYAFAIIGEGTTKVIFNQFTSLLLNMESPTGGLAVWGASSDGSASLGLPIRIDYIPSYQDIIHEMGHALDFEGGVLEDKGTATVSAVNGAYTGYTNANQYVTQYAATKASEDFAEAFRIMVASGGDIPCTLGKDTLLYKKYVAVYNLLLGEFGTGSNMVKRSAAFLGIELPAA
jgi:hypothetical protein